jgi:hypothetical protein
MHPVEGISAGNLSFVVNKRRYVLQGLRGYLLQAPRKHLNAVREEVFIVRQSLVLRVHLPTRFPETITI